MKNKNKLFLFCSCYLICRDGNTSSEREEGVGERAVLPGFGSGQSEHRIKQRQAQTHIVAVGNRNVIGCCKFLPNRIGFSSVGVFWSLLWRCLPAIMLFNNLVIFFPPLFLLTEVHPPRPHSSETSALLCSSECLIFLNSGYLQLPAEDRSHCPI